MTSTFLHVRNQQHHAGDAQKVNSPRGLVTILLFTLGMAHGDSVTQREGQLTLLEEDFLTINCTYSTSGYPTLFWYVQYPGEGPQLLFKVSKADQKANNKGFEATYDKEATSFHLQKASVRESDSAVYYCALSVVTVPETTGRAEHRLSIRSLSAEHLALGPPDSGLCCASSVLCFVQNSTTVRKKGTRSGHFYSALHED